MGLNYTTYVGPYISCKTSKVPSTKTVFGCPTPGCQPNTLYQSTSFCPVCGSKIEKKEQNCEIDNVNHQEVQEQLKESICVVPGDYFCYFMREKNVHLWIANKRITNRSFEHDSKDGIDLFPINEDLIDSEKKLFLDFYQKELLFLNEQYGEENVDVQWGLIHYVC